MATARRTITITAGTMEATAVLNDSKTADAIWRALPIEGRANRWGDEIYFSIGVSLPGENGREVVDVGDLGYWPPGKAFCIFFGPTPASQGDEPRAASPVNVFGRVEGDTTRFRAVRDGAMVTVRRAGA
ncbi:MAG: cyclophilin-like fold protein [Armatimonadota bacterium]|nr:cyclophilin-like fold protein [Armatimonadota bacterium]